MASGSSSKQRSKSRSTTWLEESIPESAGERSSLWALGGLWALGVFGAFAAAAPVQVLYGIGFAGLGALMFLFPPRVRVPWLFYGLAGLIVALASLSFLPREWFPAQIWRQEVEALGVATGGRVTPHPEQSFEFLIRLAVWLAVALYALGHRVGGRSRMQLALLFSVGAAAYAVVSMLVESFKWKLAWDPVPTFGFFLNRNHTATFLVMGTLCGVGVLRQSIREKRGAIAGAAALAITVCLAALMGYSASRAGILLLGVGGLAWLVGLGGKYLSRSSVIALLAFGGLAMGVFFFSDNTVKRRLLDTTERLGLTTTANEEAAALPGATMEAETAEIPFDLRVPIHQDTWSMIRSEPWIGVGMGAFQYVFPQYRQRSANGTWALHPESDWLQLAAETGVLTMGLLAAGAVLALGLAFLWAWNQRAWALRWGCLLAAAIVPLHSIFDVPGYCLAISWSAFFLLALTFPEAPNAPNPKAAGWLFSILGLLILLAGVFLLRGEWLGGPQSAYAGTQKLYRHADYVYRTSGAALKRREPPTQEEQASLKRNLVEAGQSVERALPTVPLLGWLYGLQGGMRLMTEPPLETSQVLHSFAIQRQLNPKQLSLMLWQAGLWKPIDPAQIPPLWRDAMALAKTWEGESVASSRLRQQRRYTFDSIMRQARGDGYLQRAALELVRDDDGPLTQRWAQLALPTLLDQDMPSLLTSTLDEETKRSLFQTWLKRGKRTLAQQFAKETQLFPDLAP